MQKSLLTCLSAGLLASACIPADQDSSHPEDYVRAVQRALRAGQFGDAREVVLRGRQRFPADAGVILMAARVRRMAGDLQGSLAALLELTRREGAGGLPHPSLQGMVGDTLFEIGRYGDSRSYLLQAPRAAASDRPAKASVSLHLPYAHKTVGVGSIEMPLGDSELPEMLCSFGEKQRAMVLDTGSTRTTLTKTMARELGVRGMLDAGLGQDSVGNSFSAWMGVLPELRLGEVDLGALPVTIVEDNRLALRDNFGGPQTPPEGVVGMDVLARYRTTFDPKRRSVTFENSRKLQGKDVVGCVFYQGVLLVPTEVDGVKMWLVLDTGASHSSIAQRGLALLPGGARRVVRDHRRARTVGGSKIVVRQVKSVNIRCSGVVFRSCTLSVVDRSGPGDFPVHGVLGADLLMLCRLTVDGSRVVMSHSIAR